jgi:BolA protein
MIRDIIETRLREALAPTSCEVIDESALHAGHAGAKPGGETHFRLKITSSKLAGLSRVAAHQQIYGLLKDLMNNPIHALAIEITPQQKS